ncbi:MAG: GTPase Era [Bacteroidota bacterium]
MKSGYIAIIGKPNAGKSTLMNALIGEKLSIITNKPQTTRKRILGILTKEDYQIIFLDTPGILNPEYLLQEKMLGFVYESVRDADIMLFLIDVSYDPDGKRTFNDERVLEYLKNKKQKKILLLNKIDLVQEQNVAKLVNEPSLKKIFDKIIPVSAALSINLDQVIATLLEFLPEHPKYFPDDDLSDENERFFVSEIIREKIFELYKEEVPYSTEVIIEEFKEREKGKDYIRAAVIVERASQKPIIIGNNGAAIKKLGKYAREEVEKFLGRAVFLELFVKVKEKWRSDNNMLKSFGYTVSDD